MKKIPIYIIFAFILGCQTISYIYYQTKGERNLLSKRKPISEFITHSNNNNLKNRLTEVLQIREFISNKLKMKINKNYLSYVELDRPWVIKLLTVSPRCSINSYIWSFPIIGEMPYLGFFDEKKALLKEQEYLESGYDTNLRDVIAFSSLGWFDDPIISTFINEPIYEIIGTLIHETTHLNIFKKDDIPFTESMAMLIEEEGTKLYLSTSNQFKILEEYESNLIKNNSIQEFLIQKKNELIKYYTSEPNCEKIVLRRQFLFNKIENEFFENFGIKISINNAYFAELNTYTNNLNYLRTELKTKFKGDLLKFIGYYINL